MRRALWEKDAITAACWERLAELDATESDAEVARLENEASSVAERLRKLVEENARVQIEQVDYLCEYDALVNEYDRIDAQIQAMEDRNRDK